MHCINGKIYIGSEMVHTPAILYNADNGAVYKYGEYKDCFKSESKIRSSYSKLGISSPPLKTVDLTKKGINKNEICLLVKYVKSLESGMAVRDIMGLSHQRLKSRLAKIST